VREKRFLRGDADWESWYEEVSDMHRSRSISSWMHRSICGERSLRLSGTHGVSRGIRNGRTERGHCFRPPKLTSRLLADTLARLNKTRRTSGKKNVAIWNLPSSSHLFFSYLLFPTFFSYVQSSEKFLFGELLVTQTLIWSCRSCAHDTLLSTWKQFSGEFFKVLTPPFLFLDDSPASRRGTTACWPPLHMLAFAPKPKLVSVSDVRWVRLLVGWMGVLCVSPLDIPTPGTQSTRADLGRTLFSSATHAHPFRIDPGRKLGDLRDFIERTKQWYYHLGSKIPSKKGSKRLGAFQPPSPKKTPFMIMQATFDLQKEMNGNGLELTCLISWFAFWLDRCSE
jgi:hypothetical protein